MAEILRNGTRRFMVPLDDAVYRALQDEAIDLSRAEDRRVPMTEIARTAIEKRLRERLKAA